MDPTVRNSFEDSCSINRVCMDFSFWVMISRNIISLNLKELQLHEDIIIFLCPYTRQCTTVECYLRSTCFYIPNYQN